MNRVDIVQKVKALERDISEIKKYLGFGISEKDLDFENWQKIKKISRNIRRELFKEKYPRLYAKSKRKR